MDVAQPLIGILGEPLGLVTEKDHDVRLPGSKIQMLLRRRQFSLSDHARNYRKRLLEFGHPATLPAANAYPQVISGLMWEACWHGMSTALQVASPPLHTQTLTVKWWTSTLESLRFGQSEYLLRALSECAWNLGRFWQRREACAPPAADE